MAAPSNQLEAMGLSDKVIGDINPMHRDYGTRLGYQNAILATNHHDRPSEPGEFFNTAQTANNHAARCNLPSPIVVCSATIVGGGTARAGPGDLLYEERRKSLD